MMFFDFQGNRLTFSSYLLSKLDDVVRMRACIRDNFQDVAMLSPEGVFCRQMFQFF